MEVLTDMAISKLGFEVIARTANNFIAKPDKERGSVLSTAQRHTNFLDDPRIVAALERSDFTMADLKTKAKTIYIVLPPNKLSTNSRFLRGFIGLALAAITGSNMRPRHPVVFMLDEFAQLGRMAAVEDAIPLVRGYGALLLDLRAGSLPAQGRLSQMANVLGQCCSAVFRRRRLRHRPLRVLDAGADHRRIPAPGALQARISNSAIAARVPASNLPGAPC